MSRGAWYAMAALFNHDPKIERLGESHGPGGPLAVVELFGMAKLQGRGGRVEGSHRVLAVSAFLDGREEARDILRDAGEAGIVEIDELTDHGFVVRLARWSRWQDAFRKASVRAADTSGQERMPADASGQLGHHRPETDDPVARTDTETGTGKTAKSPGGDPAPIREVFDAWVEATGRRKGQTKLDPKRRRLIAKALASYPLEEVLAAVRGWRHDPHNRGENDRGRPYNDIGLLLRDSEHIERFRDLELGQRNGRRGEDVSRFLGGQKAAA